MISNIFDVSFLSEEPPTKTLYPTHLLIPVHKVNLNDCSIIQNSHCVGSTESYKHQLQVLGIQSGEFNEIAVVSAPPIHKDWFTVKGITYSEAESSDEVHTTSPLIIIKCLGHSEGRRLLPENSNVEHFYGPLLVSMFTTAETKSGAYVELHIPIRLK